ncbi:MAG: TonB-dependent receptor [Parvularculaceae bacterium]|nr:TonB-dependent receptor [Caulobacterales bacterium]
MRRMVKIGAGISLGALAGALLPAGAFAADELVVTSERRAQNVSDVPEAIAVIGKDELVRIGADHPSEILARAPGVLIHRGNGAEHLTAIRSPVLTSGAGAGSFLFLENGVPLRSAGFANINALFEAHTEIADSIEVLRGPGGALYGSNAIHGVVNVLTPAPTEDLSGFISFSGDTVGRFKGSGQLSNSYGAHGFYAGVSLEHEDGYRDDATLDQQKATLRHDYDGGAVTVSSIFSFDNLNQETAGFVEGPNAYLDEVLRRTNANPDSFRDAKSVRASSRIDIQASDTVTLSITPFMRWNEMSFLMHFVPSMALEENGHWSVGAQSAAYIDAHDGFSIIGGVDWEYTEGYLRETQSIPTVFSYTQGLHYDYNVNALSASPFLQARFEIAQGVEAVIGGRLDWTRYDYINNTADGVVGRFLRPADRRDGFVTASPKASLLFDIGGGKGYVSYARGARPPQTTDLYRLQINQTSDGADPELIDSFEAGWKGAVNERVNLEVAAYYMMKRNFFFRDADGYNVDDGKTRHVGVETALNARFTPSITLDINASYGVHTYRFDRPVLSLPNATEAIRYGDDVDTAPRWLAGARGTWAPESLPVSGEIEWIFVDHYFMDAADSQTYPGHNLVNLRGEWRFSDHLKLTLAVRNVLDKLYAERADYAFGSERYFPGEERTFSVGLRADL